MNILVNLTCHISYWWKYAAFAVCLAGEVMTLAIGFHLWETRWWVIPTFLFFLFGAVVMVLWLLHEEAQRLGYEEAQRERRVK